MMEDRMKPTFSWGKLALYFVLYMVPLGFSWAGPTIVLWSVFLGPSYGALAITLGIFCAVAWMVTYFPKDQFPKQEGSAAEMAAAEKAKKADEAYSKTLLYKISNGFGIFNAVVNGFLTFFGSSMAVTAWTTILSLNIGFIPRLIICMYAAGVGFFSSYWVTRNSVNIVARKVTHWMKNRDWSVFNDFWLWVAIVSAALAAGSSMIMAYYGGFNLYAKMVALVGVAPVAVFAVLGTARGQQVLAWCLTGFTSVSSMSLYVNGALEAQAKSKHAANNAQPMSGLAYLGWVAIVAFATVSGGAQAYTVYLQLTSLFPALQAYAVLLSFPTVGVWYNFSMNFKGGMEHFVYVVKSGWLQSTDQEVEWSGVGGGGPSDKATPAALH